MINLHSLRHVYKSESIQKFCSKCSVKLCTSNTLSLSSAAVCFIKTIITACTVVKTNEVVGVYMEQFKDFMAVKIEDTKVSLLFVLGLNVFNKHYFVYRLQKFA